MRAVINQIICLQASGSVGGVPHSFFEDFGASQAGLQDTDMLCLMKADRISWHWVRPSAISLLAGSTSADCGVCGTKSIFSLFSGADCGKAELDDGLDVGANKVPTRPRRSGTHHGSRILFTDAQYPHGGAVAVPVCHCCGYSAALSSATVSLSSAGQGQGLIELFAGVDNGSEVLK